MRLSGRHGTLVIGALLLVAGLVAAERNRRFLSVAIPARAEVTWRGRSSFLTEQRTPEGRPLFVNVRLPWLSLPATYNSGAQVEILYDPRREIAQEGCFICWPEARVSSPVAIWATSAVLIVAGMLCLTAWTLAAARPRRFSTRGGMEGDGIRISFSRRDDRKW